MPHFPAPYPLLLVACSHGRRSQSGKGFIQAASLPTGGDTNSYTSIESRLPMMDDGVCPPLQTLSTGNN